MTEQQPDMDTPSVGSTVRPSVVRESARSPYAKPVLRSLGDLRALTLGRSQGNIESGQANTFRR